MRVRTSHSRLPILALCIAGCASVMEPRDLRNLPDGPVRVVLRGDATFVVRGARVVHDSLLGQVGEPATHFAVAVRQVRRVEVLDTQGAPVKRITGQMGIGLLLIPVFAALVFLAMFGGGMSAY